MSPPTTGPASVAQGELAGAERLRPGVILHFDLRANQDSLRRRVNRFLFGSKETRIVAGARKIYSYPGLIELSDGRHFGQSVVLLRSEAATKAIALFLELRVPFESLDVLAGEWGGQDQDTVPPANRHRWKS